MQTQQITPRRAELPSGWCPEDDTRDRVTARRNVLAALWAGQIMQLSAPRLAAYAAEVHAADFEAAGDGDIMRKLSEDLAAAGMPRPESEVRACLVACHREALRQTLVTD